MKRFAAAVLALVLLGGPLPVKAVAAAPAVEAKSALLMDVATGQILFEQNAHEKLPPASVTKVMTLLLIMEAIDDGVIGWEDAVTVSEAAAAKGGSQIFLKVGESMTVTDLVKSIAVSSANDAACAMAEYIAGSEAAFVERMNERAAQLGMNDTHFVNCTGLDDAPEAAEHRTSAYDIALMSRELLKNHGKIKEYTTIWMDTIRDGAFGLSNTNKLVRYYTGCTGLKTGYTSSAGYCLSASAQRDGMELIAVVMGCATSKIRAAACTAMLDYGFANYALVTPAPEENAQVPVTLGKDAYVTAVPAEVPQLLVEKARKNGITTQVNLSPGVAAPVQAGQQLGTMTVYSGEEILAQIPLVAAEGVEKLTFGDLFIMVLKQVAMAK